MKKLKFIGTAFALALVPVAAHAASDLQGHGLLQG